MDKKMERQMRRQMDSSIQAEVEAEANTEVEANTGAEVISEVEAAEIAEVTVVAAEEVDRTKTSVTRKPLVPSLLKTSSSTTKPVKRSPETKATAPERLTRSSTKRAAWATRTS